MSEINRALIPFSNEHFAAFCEKMIGQPYWLGTCLYRCTNSLLTRKAKQYPSSYVDARIARYRKDIAAHKVAADCIGGAKGYAWTGGGIGVLESIGSGSSYTSQYKAHGCPDKGTDGMFVYAKQKGMAWGTIDTLPEVVGLALRKAGHVGYYTGNGYAVEWKGFTYGCIRTKVDGRGWTEWYQLPFINYDDRPLPQPDSTVKPEAAVPRNLYYCASSRMTGEDVRELQAALIKRGFACGKIDGIFGVKTDAAVRAFQAAYYLVVDGIVGTKTRNALQSMAQQTGAESVEAPPEQDTHPQSPTQTGNEQTNSLMIQIRMTRPENIARYGSDTACIEIEEYLRGVVPAEMYESAPAEALMAQAIVSRSYAYRRRHAVLTDTSKNQLFSYSKVGKCPRADAAISATKGQILTYKGKVIDCFYCASNKGQTKRSGDVWGTHYPYYVSKADEWDGAAREETHVTSFGHGIGMSQQGAMWAARHNVSCASILSFYYENTAISVI